MNDSSNSLPPSGDDALEARIVAWVLGEASPFEAAELEKLCAGDAKLREFERRMRDLNEILAADAKPGMHAAWKLPEGKREKITDLLGSAPVMAAEQEKKVNRYFARRILLAAAACVAISLVSYPLFSNKRSVVMSPSKTVDFMPASPAVVAEEPASDVKRQKAFRGLEDGESEKLLSELGETVREDEVPMGGRKMADRDAFAAMDAPAPAAPAARPAEPELLAKNNAAPKSIEARGRAAGLGAEALGRANADFIETRDGVNLPGKMPAAGANVTDLATGGLRGGDGAVNRNSIDAVLNNPTRVPGSGHASGDLAGAKDTTMGRGFAQTEDQLAQLGTAMPKPARGPAQVEARERIEEPTADGALTGKSSAGEQAGFGLLTDSVQGGLKRDLSLDTTATAENMPALVAGPEDPLAYRFSRGDIVPRKPGEMPILDPTAPRGFVQGDADSDSTALIAGQSPGAGGEFFGMTLQQNTTSGGLAGSAGGASDVAAAEKFFFGNSAPSVSGFADQPPLVLGGTVRPKDQAGMGIVGESDYLSEYQAQQLPGILAGNSASAREPVETPAKAEGESTLAQQELARRQQMAGDAERLATEGKNARETGDLAKAYKLQTDALGLMPEAPAVAGRRAELKQSLAQIAADLAVDAKAKGKEDSAKEWAGKALQWNPQQKEAKQVLDLGGGDETSALAEPFSTFSLHVSDASYKLAKAALDRGEQPDPAGIRPEEFYNAFDYGDPAPAPGEPVVCVTEQSAHPILPQRNLVRIGVRTAAAGRGGSTPLNLTLLLDSSGSMEREDRQAAMLRAVDQLSKLLKEGDTITVAGFARTPRLLAYRLPGARAAELNTIIARTPSEGGTNLEEGLKLAEELAKRQFHPAAQNRIVLFTDGAANLGDAQPESLQARVEELRQEGIAFDAAGFGAEGLNDRLLERLTRNGNGRYHVVDRAEDAGEAFAKQLAGAFRPAAENVKVQVRFNPARVARYKLIGFEEHRLAKEDFKNDAVDAAEMAAEEAGNALYQIQPIAEGEGEIGEVSVRFRDVASGQMVERTWTIPYDSRPAPFDQAAPSMKLAGLAALTAEKLRKGPVADAIDPGQLRKLFAGVKVDFAGSEAVEDFGKMLEQLR